MQASPAKPAKGRSLLFFASIISVIALVNTPAPTWMLTTLFGPKVGESVGVSLRGFTRDLFLLLLVSIYFELVRTRAQTNTLHSIEASVRDLKNQVHDMFPKRIQALALESADPKKMIEHAVRRLFKSDKETRSIVSQLTPTKKIYNEVSIELRSLAVTEKTVSIFMSIALEAELDHVHIGVTKGAEHTSALATSPFDFFDVITIPSETDLKTIQKSLQARIKLYYKDQSDRFKELRFINVPRPEQTVLLTPPAGMTHDDFIIFRLPTGTTLTGLQKVRAEYFFEISYGEHFIYWYADRPMFVRQIIIDANTIAMASGHPVRFQLFLADSESSVVDIHESRLSMKLDKWLLDGHGAIAIWR